MGQGLEGVDVLLELAEEGKELLGHYDGRVNRGTVRGESDERHKAKTAQEGCLRLPRASEAIVSLLVAMYPGSF